MAGDRISAMIAAHAASDALAELLRFASDGKATDDPFDPETDVVALLVEALARTAEIERTTLERRGLAWTEDREALSQLISACRRFQYDWIG